MRSDSPWSQYGLSECLALFEFHCNDFQFRIPGIFHGMTPSWLPNELSLAEIYIHAGPIRYSHFCLTYRLHVSDIIRVEMHG